MRFLKLLAALLGAVLLLGGLAFAEGTNEAKVEDSSTAIEESVVTGAFDSGAEASPGSGEDTAGAPMDENSNILAAEESEEQNHESAELADEASTAAGADENTQPLAPPAITAAEAVAGDSGVWLFEVGADEKEILFVWECRNAQVFHVAVIGEDGTLVYDTDTEALELALPLELLEEENLYELHVSAKRDGASAQGSVTFAFICIGVEEEAEETRNDTAVAAEDSVLADETGDCANDAESELDDESDAASEEVSDDETDDGPEDEDTGEAGEDSTSSSSSGSSKKASKKSSSSKSSKSKSSSKSGKSSSNGRTDSGSKAAGDAEPSEQALVSAEVGFDWEKIDITLDDGASVYVVELNETTLRLSPSEDGTTWHIGDGTLDILYESGVTRLEFVLSEKVYTLQLSPPEIETEEREVKKADDSSAGDKTEICFSPALTIDENGVTITDQSLQFTLTQSEEGKKGRSSKE